MRTVFFFSLWLLSCSVVFAQTPIAAWHLDEPSGLLTQEGLSGQDFVVKNDYPKLESERIPGVAGNALRFNGYATWVEGNLAQNMPGDQISVTAWIAPEVYPMSSAAIFTNVNNGGVFLGIDKFGRLEIGATTNGFLNQKISAQKLPHWQWTHLALTVNTAEGKMRGYLNGVLAAEQTIQPGTLSWAAPNAVKIGKHHTATFSGIYETGMFCGLIDEVKIFDTALSQSQLSAIVTAEMPVAPPDMRIAPARFTGDPHRPIFHAIPPANWMNEPHGLIFHDGLYHIFYQKNGNGPYWGRLNWGHQTSPDLVTWNEQPVVLSPDPAAYDREGCWSGVSTTQNGKAWIMYTGVDGGTAQMCLAEANADLSAYQKYAGNPVVANPPAPYTSNDFRDPFIWQENGFYYMVIGSGLGGNGNSGGAALLYKSGNLTNWQYIDVLHKGYPLTDNSGIFWEVPMLLRFGNKRVLTAQPVPEPGKPARILYWTGKFENETFTPDSIKPSLLEPGDALLGVTTTTDAQNRTIAIGIIPDILPPQEQRQNGWANLMSLPRVWSLSPDGKTLQQAPLPELQKLRGQHHAFDQVQVAAGQNNFLPDISGRHFELMAKIDPGTASRVGLVLARSADNSERTRIFWEVPLGIVQIDRSASSVNPNTPKGSVATTLMQPEGQPLDLHIFLDGSVLEVFINNQKALSTRIYPEKPESIGLDLFVQGGTATIQRLDIWEMKSMYDPSVGATEVRLPKKKSVIERIFPNPGSGAFFMDVQLPEAGILTVRVLDIYGKVVDDQIFGKFTPGKYQLTLKGDHLPPGLFLAQVSVNGKWSGVEKIIRQ